MTIPPDRLRLTRYPFAIESFSILGVRIDVLTRARTLAVIDHWIQVRGKEYVVLTGAHGIIEMQNDEKLFGINQTAGLVTPDGMPEVWLGRLYGFKNIEKVYAPDIMMDVFSVSADRGYKHFFYGGKEGVAEKLTKVVEESYPGITVVGSYCPPFRPLSSTEIEDVVREINLSGADIVWCGLGCPKQERWMDSFRGLVTAPVLIGVGAGFDFLSGEKPLAPKWIQRSGLEWLYRTLSEPKRLLRRYGAVVPKFLWLNFLDMFGLFRRRSVEDS